MERIFIFWFMIICFGCEDNQSEISYSDQKRNEKAELIHRLEIEGDFDGDSILDTLREFYFSKRTQKEIPKFQFDNHTTKAIVDSFIMKNQPRTSLYISGKKDKREGVFYGKDYPTFGISGMINLGDLDNEKGDEIGIVVGSIGHSFISNCEILSYKNYEWIKINSFQIHENQIWNNSFQKVVMERKQRPIENEELGMEEQGVFYIGKGIVYMYSYDAIEGQIVESKL